MMGVVSLHIKNKKVEGKMKTVLFVRTKKDGEDISGEKSLLPSSDFVQLAFNVYFFIFAI